MLAYYGTDISPNQTETQEGFLICRNVPIARTGTQDYLARELQLDGDPERTILVNRLPEDVFETATLASFEGKPVTDGHPPENVSPENYAAYAKGHVQNVRKQGDYIVADLYVNDAALASDIRNAVKREVSCGYLCNYEPDETGYKQTHIRGNHVAVVPKGRAGATVAIKDAAPEAEKGRKKMSDFWKSVLTAFGMAAKDASPEELNTMVTTTAKALDAAPAEKAPEAEPAKNGAEPAADEMVERAPKGDDIGSKLDRILEMLEAKARGGRGEHPLHDEGDLDKMIEKLAGKEEKDPEAAVTISEEEQEDACSDPVMRDAAVSLLKKVRDSVAQIEDKTQRARVVDALISTVKGPNKVGEIMTAAQDSARKNSEEARRTNYEKMCMDSENAYASRNPHKSKEA